MAGRLGGWVAGRLGGWVAGRLGGWAAGAPPPPPAPPLTGTRPEHLADRVVQQPEASALTLQICKGSGIIN